MCGRARGGGRAAASDGRGPAVDGRIPSGRACHRCRGPMPVEGCDSEGHVTGGEAAAPVEVRLVGEEATAVNQTARCSDGGA